MGTCRTLPVVMRMPVVRRSAVALPIGMFVAMGLCMVVARPLSFDPGLTLATSANRTHLAISD
jgi:hypothetical protein